MSNKNKNIFDNLSNLYDLSYSIRNQLKELNPHTNYFDRYRLEYLSYDLSQIEFEISELEMEISDYSINDKN